MQFNENSNDQRNLTELFKVFINDMSVVNKTLLDYLEYKDSPSDNRKEEKMEIMANILEKMQIMTNKCKLEEFLKTIISLSKEHKPTKELKKRAEEIIIFLKNAISNFFSEKELLEIFYSEEYFLLTLVENNILPITAIINESKNVHSWYNREIIKYFYLEIRKHDERIINNYLSSKSIKKFKEFIDENDRNPKKFLEIRKEGENSSLFYSLIRNDNIEDFISLVEHSGDIDLKGNEYKSTKCHILGTQSFNRALFSSPIEYSSLFGSIRIFKYLYLKEPNAQMKNIMKCAIQGRNYEIIHIIEEMDNFQKENSDPNTIRKYMLCAIGCHHNEIFEYFLNTYFLGQIDDLQNRDSLLNVIVSSHNYQILSSLLQRNLIDINNNNCASKLLFYFCQTGNEEAVKILIHHSNIDINSKDEIFIIII